VAKSIRNRKCLVTQEVLPASKLIRFVAGPDADIVPDVAAKLPGRGCWIKADRETIEAALEKKVLLRAGHQLLKNIKKDVENLEADENKNKPVVKVRNDLADQIEELLHKRVLDYVGLANRASHLVAGFEKVRAALKGGKTNTLLTAIDAADNGRSKMCQGLDNLKVIDIFTREELSKAAGLSNAVHLALLPGGISTSLLREISRYERCKK
jgi:predicted RNA-binding protein YlxR (DUF448 family)/ribosomal protein L7Ae-like RNA K-turn-binding protein